MSEVKVNKISPRSGTAITLGDSGDTFTIPSGATLAIAGSVTGFTSAGIDDNATSTAITISSGEDVTFTENILLGDNKKAKFGTGNDLEIYHEGNHSFISDVGTGVLALTTNGTSIQLNHDGENMLLAYADAQVELFHNNSKKFETAGDGILVNGAANIDAGGEPSATGMIKLQANASQRQLRISPPSNLANGKIDYRGGNLTFQDDGTEVARFQDTTALMIGKSSLDYEGTAGIILRNDGLLHATRDGGNVTDFNRLSSDGEVVRFSKDGTTSGQINISGSRMNIGTGNTAIRFDSNSRLILPWNVTSNSATGVDAEINLGAAGGFRFKDLYLGGGLYVGGTGTANKLDDYEEGTWTPTADAGITSLSVNGSQNTYTKVGRLVTVYCEINAFGGKSSSALLIGGLPFTPDSNSHYLHGGIDSDGGALGVSRTNSTTGKINFYLGTTSRTSFTGNNLGNGARISLTYFAA